MRPVRMAGEPLEPRLTANSVFGEPGLHGLKQLPFNDRLVSPLMGRPAINDLADVKAVLEQMSKCAGPKTDAAPDPAVDKPTCLRADTTPVEVLDQGANGAQAQDSG